MDFYDQTVPVFSRGLNNLAVLLEKSRAHAEAAHFEMSALLGARLFPDMFPLTRQIQLVTDFAKGGASRLAGVDVPRWEDTETTLADLQGRITRAVDYLGTLTRSQFENAASRRIELKTPGGEFHFNGTDFLQQWALPNFYFHAATAYNLLRHNGVPIGKLDFLGKV